MPLLKHSDAAARSRSAAPPTFPLAWHVFAACVVFGGHVALRAEEHTFLTGACAGLLGALTLLAGLRYVTVRPDRLPWIEFVLAIQYTQHAIATTRGPTPAGIYGIVPSTESYQLASALGFLGAVAAVCGFGLAQALSRPIRAERLFPQLTPEIAAAATWPHLLIASVFNLSPSLLARMGPLATLAYGIFGTHALLAIPTYAYARRPSIRTLIPLLVAISVLGVNVVRSSMLGDAIMSLLAAGTIWYSVRGKVPKLPLGLAVGIFLVVQPVKHTYREIRISEGDSVGTIEAWQRAFNSRDEDDEDADAARDRLDELRTFAYVIEVVPRDIAYGGGRTYGLLPALVVPRILWPDKPYLTTYGVTRFAIDLGLNTEDNARSTTIGITTTTLGYYEHGWIGSLAWMFLVGGALALLSSLFRGRLNDLPGGVVVLVWITPYVGAGLTGFVGSFWQAAVIGLILPRVMVLFGSLTNASQRRPSHGLTG